MKYILALLIIALSTSAFSTSEATPPVAVPNTLQQQYANLKSDLEIIDGYRMIKMFTMDKLWAVVIDSINSQKVKTRELANLVAKQQMEVREFKNSVAKIEGEREELKTGVDNLVVFGGLYSKAGFIAIVSFVIVGLLVLVGVLFSASRVSYHTTQELKKLNESLNQEFDRYKHNAVEKEIKLSRELQNYRNKLAELKVV